MFFFIFEQFLLMKFNYKRGARRSHDVSSSSSRIRRRRRSSSSESRDRSHRHRRSQHRNGRKRYSRDRRHYSRDKDRHYSRDKDRQHQHARKDHRYRINRRRSPSSPSPSSSSPSPSSSSPSPSSDVSSSISSSTRKRRTTPHFKFKIGEKLGHKYRVTRLLGTGTFGRVLEARYKEELFAVKIIKPVQKYVDSAKTERNIVKTLNQADHHNRSHIIKFIESFYHHQYYCMVFQPLGPSLYDIIKRNNHNGYPIKMVQAFASQLFESVAFMHANGYTHTDLKPENILLCTNQLENKENYVLPSDDRVKLIDFGGATHSSERHSSIINTRQYRSPEVILQCCEWKESSDVWSIGCIISELYTGNLLFPTHDDLQHLLMIMKNAKQNLPGWMIRRCKNDLAKAFKDNEVDDRVTLKRIKHWEDIDQLVRIDQIFKNHPQLCHLLQRCLEMDPAKRITCQQALRHPFFEEKL